MRHGTHQLADGTSAVLVDAEGRHADKVWALLERVLCEGRYFLRDPDEIVEPVRWVTAEIERHRADPGSLYLLARRKGQVVGVLHLGRSPLRRIRHDAHFEVYLAPELRGQGLGAALLDAAIEWAVSSPELTRLSLSVFADNATAIGLYQGRGFEVEGRRRGVVREADGSLRDDLLMSRRVG